MVIKHLSNRLTAHRQKKSTFKRRFRLSDRRLAVKAAQAVIVNCRSDRIEMVEDNTNTPTSTPTRMEISLYDSSPYLDPIQKEERCHHAPARTSYSVELKSSRHCRSNMIPRPHEGNSSLFAKDKISSPKVHFAPQVDVIEIPSHRDYSARVRDALWRTSRDIRRSAKRNAFEYYYDGNDWQNCTEEEGMIMWRGELLHPFTYQRLQVVIAKKQREQEDFQRALEENQRCPKLFRPKELLTTTS